MKPDELEIEMEIVRMEREVLRESSRTDRDGAGASAELAVAALAEHLRPSERLYANRLLGWSRSLERRRMSYDQWSEWQEW